MALTPKLEIKADVSKSVDGTFGNLALPASKKIGMALGNVVGLFYTASLPIKLLNEYAERNYQKLEDKINAIPEGEIKEVEPEIAIPLMEKLSYTSSEDLSNTYASLLANASNINRVDLIHPGFINKIQSLAPDEVKLLEYFRTTKKSELLYIQFKGINTQNNQQITVSVKLSGLEKEYEIPHKRMAMHLENLISLSILKDKEGMFKVDDTLYDHLHEQYKDIQDIYENEVQNGKYPGINQLKIEKSFYSVTELGRAFIEACGD